MATAIASVTIPRLRTLTRRTDGPKLAYLEKRLTEANVPFIREGHTGNHPVLKVSAETEHYRAALDIIDEEVEFNGEMTPIDSLPNDHPMFS